MATVTVTKRFKENFDLWAKDAIESGEWTRDEMEGIKGHDDEMYALGLRGILRNYELADGPDRMRATLTNRLPDGTDISSAIDDPKERFEHWDSYFNERAEEIRKRSRTPVFSDERKGR